MARPTAKQALSKTRRKLVDLETTTAPKTFVGLHYGDKGQGKTTAALAIAQQIRGDGDILLLDSSDGWVSLDNIPALKRNVQLAEHVNVYELADFASRLEKGDPEFADVTVVVLDEISTWYTDTLHAYAREQQGIPEGEPLKPMDWGMYGAPQQAMLEIIKRFHRSGRHLIMMAHEQARQLEGTTDATSKRKTAAMGVKLADGIGQIAHVVARFESRAVKKMVKGKSTSSYERTVQSIPTRLVDAKSRIGALTKETTLDVVTYVRTVVGWVHDSEQQGADLAAPEPEAVGTDAPDDEDFEVSDDESEAPEEGEE